MLQTHQIQDVLGQDAYSQDGEKVGKVGQLFLNDQTEAPEFITVEHRFIGSSESFVPVQEASMSDGQLTVPFSKDKVKDAPNMSADDGHLSEDQERELYRYYGMAYSGHAGDTGLAAGGAPTMGTDTTAQGAPSGTTPRVRTPMTR